MWGRVNWGVGKMNMREFGDGELGVCYEECMGGGNVLVVEWSLGNWENLMEVVVMVDGGKRGCGKSVIGVIGYFGWGGEERKEKGGVWMGGKLVGEVV